MMDTAAQLLDQGWKLHQAGQHADAEQVYRQALQLAPSDANAWCYLGMALHDQDRWEEAVAAYQRALQIQPQFPVAYNNFGNTLRLMRRLPEAISCFDAAIKLKPDYVNAHKNKGTALVWEGHLDEAVTCYQRAMELAPDDAETRKNLGVIWLLQGKFDEGWREYEWRWQTKELGTLDFPTPKWDGSSLDGKTILLTAEQGLGDTIHFVRYAALLKRRFDCRVIVAAQPALLPLLRSCDGPDQWIEQNQRPLPAHDCFCPLLSVPGVLRETTESIEPCVPYLAADERLVNQWRERLSDDDGFRVGIVWQGNPKYRADRMRSFPLAELLPLARWSGVRLFSLQKGHGTEQLEIVAGRLEIVPLGDELDERTGAFVETAAVLKNLDLLITPDTAVAHLAGALGVRTWMAIPYVPEWRWRLDRDDTPWYPSVRLFRQQQVGDWSSVFERMADELPKLSDRIVAKRPQQHQLATTGFNRLIAGRYGLTLYNRRDIYVGRSLELYGEYSEGEADLFRQLLRPNCVVVEAGAHLGAHTLAFSQFVGPSGRVYAFEPQRVLFQTLCANAALNSRTNVHAFCQAVGARAGETIVPPLDYDAENNFAALGLGSFQRGERVPVVTIDGLQLPRLDLLKVDVEGMEIDVLRGAAETIARCRPILYVDNDRREDSAELFQYIGSLGYDMYWHTPPLFHPANYFNNPENVFGNVVSANMLCVHSSVASNIQGLRPVEGPDSDWRSAR